MFLFYRISLSLSILISQTPLQMLQSVKYWKFYYLLFLFYRITFSIVICVFIYLFHLNTINSLVVWIFASLFIFVHLAIFIMHYLKIINPLQGSFDRTVKEMIKNDMVKDVKELEMFGSRVDERNVSVFRHSNNESLWMRAFKSVNIKNMKYLLSIDSCIDVNEQDEQYGQSPIIYASIKNNIHAVKFLLNHPKINVNKCDSSGCSALLYAVKNDHFEIIQLLVESGADINIANSETGQTPIICASIHNNVNTIELLLRQPQIDVNHFDNNGWSALMYGVKNGHFKIAQSLIEAGADINATQNNNNETPLLIAIKQGHVKLVLWMLDNGIKYGLDTTIKQLQGGQVRECYCHSQNEDIVDGHDEFKNENKNSSNRNYDWIMGIRLLNELQERNTYSPCEMLCRDTGEILIDTSVTDNNGQTSWVYCWKSNNISLMTEYIRYHETNNIKWNISEMDWSKHNNALTCLFSKICLYTKNGITFDKQIALLELMIHHFVNQFVSCTQSNIQFKWPTIAGDSMFEWLFTQLKLQEDHFAIMAWKKKIGRAFSIICGAIATILYKSETDSFTKSEMMFINTINSAKWVHFLEPSISLQSIQHFVQCLIDPIHPIKVNNILAMVDTYDSPLVMFAKVSVVQAKNEIFHQKCDELIRWLKCEYIVAGLESREKVIKFINTKSKQLNVTPIVLAIRNKNYYLAKMMLITFGCHVDVFDSPKNMVRNSSIKPDGIDSIGCCCCFKRE